jgi:hypothetical protein
MTAIHNREGVGEVAATPQLLPHPFHNQQSVISNARLNDAVG